jgi:hypothetical protein
MEWKRGEKKKENIPKWMQNTVFYERALAIE